MSIDEHLMGFRERVPFRVYMGNKPDKYGIKIWMMCDVETHYALNFQVYTGKEGETAERNQGKRVVLDLSESLPPGRGITTDNFFTGVDLAQELLKRKLTLLGTIKKNRREIPSFMLSSKQKEVFSSKFVFSDNMTLVSYVPKK